MTNKSKMLYNGWPRTLSSSSTLQSGDYNKIIPSSRSSNVDDGGITLCTDSAEAMVYVKYQNKTTMVSTSSSQKQEEEESRKKSMFGRWRQRRSGSSTRQQRRFKVRKLDSEYEWGEEKLADDNDYEEDIQNESGTEEQQQYAAAATTTTEVNRRQQVVSKSVVLGKGVTLTLTLTVCDEEEWDEEIIESSSGAAAHFKEEEKEDDGDVIAVRDLETGETLPCHQTTDRDDFDLEDLDLEELEALAVQNLHANDAHARYYNNNSNEERVLLDGAELNFADAKAIVVLLQDMDLRRNITGTTTENNLASSPHKYHAAAIVNDDDEKKMHAVGKTAAAAAAEVVLAETTAVIEKLESSAKKKMDDNMVVTAPAASAAPLVTAVVVADEYPDLDDVNSQDLAAMALLGTAETSFVAVAVVEEDPESAVVAKVNAMKMVDFEALAVVAEKEEPVGILKQRQQDIAVKDDKDDEALQGALANVPSAASYKGPDELEFVLPPGLLQAAFVGHPPVVTEIFENSPLPAEGVVVGMMVDTVTITDADTKKKQIYYEMSTLALTKLLGGHGSSDNRHIRFVAPHYIVTPPPIPLQISMQNGCCAVSVQTAITTDPFESAALYNHDDDKEDDNNAAATVTVEEKGKNVDANDVAVAVVAVAVVEEKVDHSAAAPAGGLVVSRVDSSNDIGVWTDSPVNNGTTNQRESKQPLASGVVLSTIPDENVVIVDSDYNKPKIDVWMDLPESISSENEDNHDNAVVSEEGQKEDDNNNHRKIASNEESVEADSPSVNAAAACTAAVQDDDKSVVEADALSVHALKIDDNNEKVEVVSQMNYTWENLSGKKDHNLPGEINCDRGEEDVSVATSVSAITQYTNFGMKKKSIENNEEAARNNNNNDGKQQHNQNNDLNNNFNQQHGVVINRHYDDDDDDDEEDESSFGDASSVDRNFDDGISGNGAFSC